MEIRGIRTVEFRGSGFGAMGDAKVEATRSNGESNGKGQGT